MVAKRGGGNRVYSTEVGRICPACGCASAQCRCAERTPTPAGDGIVRLHRESKGRGGKSVTVIRGLPLATAELTALAKQLKRRCGVGGTVKDGTIEIQGEQRALLQAELQARGYTVKLAGG